jgi:hypothetical protein
MNLGYEPRLRPIFPSDPCPLSGIKCAVTLSLSQLLMDRNTTTESWVFLCVLVLRFLKPNE